MVLKQYLTKLLGFSTKCNIRSKMFKNVFNPQDGPIHAIECTFYTTY